MDVAVELSRIVIVDTSPQQVIVLKEIDGERSFPIMIGVHEALVIDRRWKGIELERPMTHDLLGGVVEAMGGTLEKIVVNDLQDLTFYAKLVISRAGELVEVDARPSDAIALAVGLGRPVFVAEHVFEKVGGGGGDLSVQLKSLQLRHDQLVQQITIVQDRLEDNEFRSSADDKQIQSLQQRFMEMQAELDAIEEVFRQLP